jgi:hypothetical protein
VQVLIGVNKIQDKNQTQFNETQKHK